MHGTLTDWKKIKQSSKTEPKPRLVNDELKTETFSPGFTTEV
jgi:hypothetical protein